MKKLIIIISVLFSTTAFAHSGHSLLEFMSIMEMVKHYFNSLYHIIAMLVVSMMFITSAVVIHKRKQILSAILMTLGFIGSVFGIGILLI